MKLAFCIFKYYPFGGLERNFLRITEECLRRGHSITIFTMRWDGDIPDTFSESDCDIVKVPFKGVSNHARCFSYEKNLSKLLNDADFDLVVGFNRMPGLDLYYCADVCFKADIRKRHSWFYRFTPRYMVYSAFEEAVFGVESNTSILALSDIQRAIYKAEYKTPDKRFFPIPAGIDKERIRSAVSNEMYKKARKDLNLADDEYMLLMVGSDFRRKGVIRSIRSVVALPGNLKSKTKLFVIGKGHSQNLGQIAEQHSVHVTFTGAVDDVPMYLSASDFLLHPAVSENTGNAIVEALISGTPVIATSNCGYAFHVLNANAGRVIDGVEFSQEEMNNALKEMLDQMTDKRGKWFDNAIEYSDNTDFYSRPSTVADIIESLIKEKSLTTN